MKSNWSHFSVWATIPEGPSWMNMLRGDRAFKKSMLGFVPLSGTDHPLWPKDYMVRRSFSLGTPVSSTINQDLASMWTRTCMIMTNFQIQINIIHYIT